MAGLVANGSVPTTLADTNANQDRVTGQNVSKLVVIQQEHRGVRAFVAVREVHPAAIAVRV